VTKEHETLASGVHVVRVARSPLWKWRKRKASSSGVENKPGTRTATGPIGKMSLTRQVLRIIARLWTHLGLIIQMMKSCPDVVHAHDVNTLPTAWIVAALSRSPLVYDAHEISTDREGYPSFRSLVGFVEKHLMPRAIATITTTDIRAKFFARAYGIPRPLVLQNRPRLSVVERSQRLREELQLDQPWPIVLYQGGLQQGRGLDRLVDVAAEVEDAYFVFIGGGRMEALLKDRARSRRLENRVYFIPTVSLQALPYYTASADIGVQPIENTCLNHFSTDSNKLFEYIIAGLPVVTSSLPEIRKVVEAYDLGLLVSPGNSRELVSALRSLVSNHDLREHYHFNAVRAAKFLNWEEQESGLIDLYANVLSGTVRNA
jgi:glycosyltransferase involved in cell wall biosynthesis